VLQSMTGFGEAHSEQDGLAVAVEIRAINNRYFKLSVRTTEGYAALEPLVEGEVRRAVHRGTIQVNLRLDRKRSPEDYRINLDVLERYRRQLECLHQGPNHVAQPASLEALLPLPGVVDDASGQAVDATADWPIVQRTVQAALKNLGRMRTDEGLAMATDLTANCRAAAASLDQVERRAPLVIDEYRSRLFDRLKRTLAELNVALEPGDVIKEVGLFADRSDISEEIVRLRSHLEQFQTTMELPESSGRKLDFLTQEMFREANTIGSKGNDVEIAKHVIEIKTSIERIREMIQNVE
jgi:uncharacterized protein (TIGR00255 family)